MSNASLRAFCAYGFYHQNKWNQLVHFIFVPFITFSYVMLLVTEKCTFSGYLVEFEGGFGVKGDVASVLTGLLSLYYLYLDVPVGLTLAAQLWGFVLLSNHLLRLDFQTWLWIVLVCQIVGWGAQFAAHKWFEGRRPALIDNLFQVFNAPFFVMIEGFFFFGYKPDLYGEIQKELQRRNREEKQQ